MAWLHAFQPDGKLRDLVLDTIRGAGKQHSGEDQDRRRELFTQLDRLQDLYVLGDLTKPRYIMRRQALEEELQRLAPPADPDLDRAQALLGDFARFWRTEPNPAERRMLLTTLFDHIWQDNGQIIAVKPRPAFAPYFKAIDEAKPKPPKANRQRGVTNTGATGLEPATSAVTGQRSNLLSYAPAIASLPGLGRGAPAVCQGLSSDPGFPQIGRSAKASIGLPLGARRPPSDAQLEPLRGALERPAR